MTHEPECPHQHLPEHLLNPAECPDCERLRAAYQRGREEDAAAIQRVRELHNETNMGGCSDPEHCSPADSEPICGSCFAEWPCPTIAALEGSHE